MLFDMNLPKHFWGKAILCAVYQLNRLPTRALDGKISAGIFYNKSDLNMQRIV